VSTKKGNNPKHLKNKIMKTTTKEYTEKFEEKREAGHKAQNAKCSQDYNLYHELMEKVNELETEFFDKLDTVSVHFTIGGRNYYRDVVKIGKKYFSHGRSMTKGNGHYGLTEIDEINNEMQTEMIADSYYY
jgi:hypothetical protein